MTDPQEIKTAAKPYWGPIATLGWAALIAISFVLAQLLVLFAFLVVMTTSEGSSEQAVEIIKALESNGLFLSIATFATTLICCPLVFGIVKLKRGSNLTDYLGLTLPNRRQLLCWLGVIISFCVVVDVVTLLLHRPIVPEFMTKAYTSTGSPWILWLAVIVAAPVFEELFFRGFLIRGLAESKLRWPGAVLVSAGLWAAIHLQYGAYEIFVIFILGLILGMARIKTGSTLLTLLLHSVINLAATVEVALSLRGR